MLRDVLNEQHCHHSQKGVGQAANQAKFAKKLPTGSQTFHPLVQPVQLLWGELGFR
jgi:hypothetical protein